MKGHVELVMISDENYWSIFVDGQHYCNTHHADYKDVVFRTGDRKELAKMAGVDVDDLRYSVYENFFYKMDEKDPDYEACDYLEDYQAFSDALRQHSITADKNASQLTLEQLESIP